MESVSEEIKRVVGVKNIDNKWRSSYLQWKEWGATEADIKAAKMICIKRIHTITPSYMEGTIKKILSERRK